MEEYEKLVELLVRSEEEISGVTTSRDFAPSSSISELAIYLCRNGVRVVGGEE